MGSRYNWPVLEEIQVACPHCGEPYTTQVDTSAGDATFIEDCWVCCRPMELRVTCSLGEVEEVSVEAA